VARFKTLVRQVASALHAQHIEAIMTEHGLGHAGIATIGRCHFQFGSSAQSRTIADAMSRQRTAVGVYLAEFDRGGF
jgi:hypothetical protein